jgi:DNA-binding GntR family transcriptional regulator
MPAAVSADDWSRLAELDLAFHSALVQGSGNSRLTRIYATLAAESRICIVNLEGSYPRVDELVDEHERIVTLLADQRGEALRHEILQHMDKAVADLTSMMNSQAS